MREVDGVLINRVKPTLFKSGNRLIMPELKESSRGMAAMIVSEDELVEINHMPWMTDTAEEVPSISKLTKEIFSQLNDSYDFIIFVTNQRELKRLSLYEMASMKDKSKWPPDTISMGGYCITVKNEIEGLDFKKDLSLNYGSAGNLDAIVLLYDRDYIRNGPILHEIGHRWGMYFPGTLGNGPHLDVTNLAGQMSYYMPFQREGEHFVVRNKRSKSGYIYQFMAFNSWELYLMGLERSENLPPVQVLEGMHYIDSKRELYGGEVKEYTFDRLYGEIGERKPGVEESQKVFSSLFVLLSAREIEQAEWDHFQSQVEWFTAVRIDSSPEVNFYEATLGRAQMICGESLGAR